MKWLLAALALLAAVVTVAVLLQDEPLLPEASRALATATQPPRAEPTPLPEPVLPGAPFDAGAPPSAVKGPPAEPSAPPAAEDAGELAAAERPSAAGGPESSRDAGANPLEAAPLGNLGELDAGVEGSEETARKNDSDPRFRIPWDQPGFCPGKDAAALKERRQALVSTFVPVQVGEALIYRAPTVGIEAVREVAQALLQARDIAGNQLDWSRRAAPPPVYLYATQEGMREVACVSAQTVGYYDGAIHLSGDPADGGEQLRQTVVHEYTHHALRSLGVLAPMWLHEGMAMVFAEEGWWRARQERLEQWLIQSHLPFDALVKASPHTADAPFATATYFQSYAMVRFLLYRRGPDILRALTRDLAAQRVTLYQAFPRGAGLSESELEGQWRGFVEQGGTR